MAVSHEDIGNQGDVLPVYKRRGRPLKPSKDDAGEAEKAGEEEGGDSKAAIPVKEVRGPAAAGMGKKRKRHSLVKDRSISLSEENGVKERSNFGDSTRSSGFRQHGSRRKSTPRRAAEAVVECKWE